MRTHLLARTTKLHGKELSFNNLLDLDSGRRLIREFELPAAAILKHNNPCGCAVADSLEEAYERALACDPDERLRRRGRAQPPDRQGARRRAERELRRAAVRARLRRGRARDPARASPTCASSRTPSGASATSANATCGASSAACCCRTATATSRSAPTMEVAGEHKPTEQQWGDLLFAWKVCKHVRSNAIVLAKDLATIGIGAGQMSRVDSVRARDRQGARRGRVRWRARRSPPTPSSRSPTGPSGDRGRRQGDHPAGRLEARRRGDRGLRQGRHRDGLHRPPPLPALARAR